MTLDEAPPLRLDPGQVIFSAGDAGREMFIVRTEVGAGLGYTFPNSGASLFAEWDGWVYRWDNNSLLDPATTNVDRTQFDSTWSAGVRYVF